MTCPRCESTEDLSDFYGPCGPCRVELRRNARRHMALRRLLDWWVTQ